jgi:hypothetical protein
MAGLKSAVMPRVTPKDYTVRQSLLVGLWFFDIWDNAAFSNMFEGEERKFMPRLLVGCCVAFLKQRVLTTTEAFIVMDAKHGRTAAKYIGIAESLGFLTKERDPDGDARKTLLMPTEQLLRKFFEETGRMANDTREFLVALAQENGLPETGAAEIHVRRRRNEINRHITRIESNPPFPPRNWSGAHYSPKSS